MERTLDYKELLLKRLRDNPEESVAYLNAALEDEDPKVFLIALRDVVEAHGGMSKISKQSQLNRESLYRMLSEKGNPELASISKLLKSIGFNLAIYPKS
jgi:probable addiction module antidote protein